MTCSDFLQRRSRNLLRPIPSCCVIKTFLLTIIITYYVCNGLENDEHVNEESFDNKGEVISKRSERSTDLRSEVNSENDALFENRESLEGTVISEKETKDNEDKDYTTNNYETGSEHKLFTGEQDIDSRNEPEELKNEKSEKHHSVDVSEPEELQFKKQGEKEVNEDIEENGIKEKKEELAAQNKDTTKPVNEEGVNNEDNKVDSPLQHSEAEINANLDGHTIKDNNDMDGTAPIDNMDATVPNDNKDATAPDDNKGATVPDNNMDATIPIDNKDTVEPNDNKDATPNDNEDATVPKSLEEESGIPEPSLKLSDEIVSTDNEEHSMKHTNEGESSAGKSHSTAPEILEEDNQKSDSPLKNSDEKTTEDKHHKAKKDENQMPDSGDSTPLEENKEGKVTPQKEMFENDQDSNSKPSLVGDLSTNKKKPKAKQENYPGQDIYTAAEKLLNQTKKDYRKAYKLLAEAAELGHPTAMEKTANSFMFGDYLPRNITKSVEYFHKLAEKGNPVGQQGLAYLYGTGTGVPACQAKALVYTTFAALGNDVKAQMNLAYRHWGGIGVSQSCEAALTYYRKVSKKVAEEIHPVGSPAVHRIRLYDELEQGNAGGNLDDDLLQYYQFLADKGDVQAQVGLGQLYLQGGRGVETDHQKAFKYFKQAADAGNANAQAYLGKMYYEGSSAVPQDNETAYTLFSRAVDQGNPVGHSGLGLLYMHGSGVEKDYGRAMSYFSAAAEQGLPEAQLQLGNIYYHGLGVNRDYQHALKYFTLASQSGNVLALYNLASMHASGNGVMRSCHTATELFKSVAQRGKWSSLFTDAYVAFKAGDIDTALLKYYILAELGYEAAQSNVAYILDKGESSLYPKNETFARALLQWNRAASQGFSVARVKVGDYHYYGLGTKVDYELAALHYRLASEQQSNAQAMFNLGYMHEQGLGLKKDIHLAKRFYDMAAESNPEAQVPVTLALAKLGTYFTLDWMKQKFKSLKHMDIHEVFGHDWDLYIITILAILLGLILLIRSR